MSAVEYIGLGKIKTKWYKDILSEWTPNREYIVYLQTQIEKREYIPPIVVTQEGDEYVIINGHHRYYAHLLCGEKSIKCICIGGDFNSSEPLRQAEILLKEYDQQTGYRYQFAGFLDRWAAAAEKHDFIDKYRPTLSFKLYMLLRKWKNKLLKKI